MTDLARRVVALGTARRWIDGVSHRLVLGEQVLALFPPTVDALPVVQAIVVVVEERGCRVAEIDLGDLHPAHPPLVSLPAALGVTDRHVMATPEALADLPGLPDVVHATSIDRLAPDRAEQWLALMLRLARVTGGRRSRPPAVLCPVSEPARLAAFPAAAPRLAVVRWSGIPSATELRLACREVSDAADVPRRLWREHVLSSLCGNDVRLAERLWDVVFESRDAVRASLLAYAEERGWTDKALEHAGAAGLGAMTSSLSVSEVKAAGAVWAMGALIATEEFGTELHPAAMAVLRREAGWIHRLWRGQAILVLPLLEDLRLRVCLDLSDTFGQGWPFQWQPPASEEERREVSETPLAASWGFLSHLYRTVPLLGRDVALAPLVQRARVMRNELAHNRLVSYVDFKTLHGLMGAFTARSTRGG
jgi:hypothetical protein